MAYGIDFYDTITKHPKAFKKIATALTLAGDTVYIISAVNQSNVPRLREAVKKSKIPHTHLEVIVFKNYLEVPDLKLASCRRLGIKVLFDDREDVCSLLAKYGIVTAQIR